jgi:tryptophan synthase alpha chain
VNRLVECTKELRRKGRRGLAPFITAGDGGLGRTLSILRTLDDEGIACVELGLPFSDPIADGPVLQAAADRALADGTTFEGVCALLRALRAGDRHTRPSTLPIAIMSYANPLFVRGIERSARELAAAGADAWLVPDLPVEESPEFCAASEAAGLATIFFVAPTTSDERARAAVRASRGFLYAIGRFGVTGASAELSGPAVHSGRPRVPVPAELPLLEEDAQEFLARMRALAGDLPLAVGFGIDSAEKVRAAVRHADLAIVGSALVDAIHRAGSHPRDVVEAAAFFIQDLKKGLRP